MEIEKERMTLEYVHSSALKIKDRGDTESSTYTTAEKELSKKAV